MIKAKKVLGIITFFRSEEWGNFTEREIFILDIMKDHLSNMAEACMLKKADQMISENQNITPREKEIIDLIIKGYTNEEIAKELYISVSTTKKHVYNIFKKY